MTDMRFRKRAVESGWSEVVIVMPLLETPDCELVGEDARRKICKFVIGQVAGLAMSLGESDVAAACLDIADAVGCFDEQGS